MGEESELNTEKRKERKEAQRLLSELIIIESQPLFSFYIVSLIIHKIKLFWLFNLIGQYFVHLKNEKVE